MKVQETTLPGVLLIEPLVHGDERGFFFESFHWARFMELTGCALSFVQDNHSKSGFGVLRGIHYQIEQPQGKLVRVIQGAVWDVAVDLRRSSPTFGKCFWTELSAENRRQLWIPPGFGHGFLTLTDWAEMLYKTTDYYAPQHERCIRWNDPLINIPWPLQEFPKLSKKDQQGALLADADTFQ